MATLAVQRIVGTYKIKPVRDANMCESCPGIRIVTRQTRRRVVVRGMLRLEICIVTCKTVVLISRIEQQTKIRQRVATFTRQQIMRTHQIKSVGRGRMVKRCARPRVGGVTG